MTTFPSKMGCRNISDLVLDLFNKADLHSSRDRFGRVRYLMAELPFQEFYSLYNSSTLAVIYNRGVWMTVHSLNGRLWVTGKLCKTQLDLGFQVNAKGQRLLIVSYKDRILKRVRLARYNAENLVGSPAGIQLLSNIAKGCFADLGERSRVCAPQEEPVIHVFPKKEELAEVEFSRDLVSLH